MSFKQAVLLVIMIFLFLSFAAGYAQPDKESVFEPGLAPVVSTVIR